MGGNVKCDDRALPALPASPSGVFGEANPKGEVIVNYRKEIEAMDKDLDDHKVDKVITTATLAVLAKLDVIQSKLEHIESELSSIKIREMLRRD